jgi:hypothetical protein
MEKSFSWEFSGSSVSQIFPPVTEAEGSYQIHGNPFLGPIVNTDTV